MTRSAECRYEDQVYDYLVEHGSATTTDLFAAIPPVRDSLNN